jgi:hypothetical protein
MDDDKQQLSIAQSVKTMRDNLPALLELAAINARLVRAKFVALQNQGFTESQALELCKSL